MSEVPQVEQTRTTPDEGRIGRFLAHRATGWATAAVLAMAAVGLSVGLFVASGRTVFVRSASEIAPFGRVPVRVSIPAGVSFPSAKINVSPGILGSADDANGNLTFGTVRSTSSSSFSVSTLSGSNVTIEERSSTVYRRQEATTTSSAISKGALVLVFGSRQNGKIYATDVVVLG